MFWLLVFVFRIDISFGFVPLSWPAGKVCERKFSEHNMWWESYRPSVKKPICEVLDVNNEECGVCGVINYNKTSKNICNHIQLLWKFNWGTEEGKQVCFMMDHCSTSYAVKKAQDQQAREGKSVTNFMNYVCGTDTPEGKPVRRGKCKSMFGTYMCECQKGYQGRDCNDLGPAGAYATGVQVLMDIKVRVSHMMTVLIAVKNKGINLKVHVDMLQLNRQGPSFTIFDPVINDTSSKKIIKYCEKNTALKTQCATYLNESTSIYSINLRFPLVRDMIFIYYYTHNYRKIPIGYYTNFTITTTNTIDGVEKESFYRTNFDRAYNVFVEYPRDIGCYKNILILNCKEVQDKVNIYDASTEIVVFGESFEQQISGEERSMDCQARGEQLVKWKVSQVMPDGRFLLIDKIDSKDLVSYEIRPYLLRNGIHIVELSYAMFPPLDTTENFEQCFFTVVEAPLVAIIDGGKSRYADVDTEIIVDGSRSHDPNLEGMKGKEGLNFEWSCTIKQTKETCLQDYLSPKLSSGSYVKLPPSILIAKKEYLIHLTVKKIGKVSSDTSQTLLCGRDRRIKSIEMVCVNCKEGNIANPTDYIYLLVKVVLKPNVIIESSLNFTWTFSTHPVYPPDASVERIRVNQTAQDLLKIEKYKLEENSTYYFRAALKEDSTIFSEIDIRIPLISKVSCSITPESGIVAVTNFTLKCSEFSSTTYEVYDKSLNDPNYYSGRMLFTGFNPVDNYFKMAKGKIVVYGYNKFKMIQVWDYEVKLTPFDGLLNEIDDMVSKLEYVKIYEQRILHATSVIPGALKPAMDWSSISLLKRLIAFVGANQIKFQYIRFIKLVLSSLEFIFVMLSGTDNKIEFKFEVEEAKMCSGIIYAMASNLFEGVKEFNNQKTLTDTILQQMIRSHLDVIQVVFNVKNAKELSSKPLYLLDPHVLKAVKDTSNELVDALYKISSCLLWRQMQGDSPTEITSTGSKMIDWAVVDHPTVLYHLRRQYTDIPFNFSVGFYKIMKNMKVLGIQVTNLKVNPFWWAGGDINTNILLVDICFKVNLTQCKSRRTFYKAPIYLYFNISQIYHSIKPIEIHTVYLNFSKDPNNLDLDVTVYRFDPPLRAKLFIQFEFENSANYKVVFSLNTRPDFEQINKQGITINNKNQSTVTYLKYIKDNSDKLYYMGIFPVSEGVSGKKSKFNLTIVHIVCKTWLKWKWGHERCWVGEQETDERTLRCDCNHLSMFAGAVQVPPYTLNPAMEFLLFLTEEFNWLPTVMFITILLVFMILFVWGRCKDSRDLTMGIVTILEDNYPGEPFAYLIGVYTGSRINASTDANVGVKLFGENNASRAHILANSNRLVLQGNSDDWFLLYSPVHLGTLESLHVWHDNQGKSPDWFVEKIEIYDLSDKVEYIFQLNIWLALGVNEFPEAVIATSSIEDFYSVRQVFISNVVTGFRDTNYWTSIFWKHARNPVKRVHRICVVLCFVMTAMICSVLIFHFNKGEEYEEDEPSYNLNRTDFTIFVISLIAASFIACLIMFFFRKSFSHKYKRMQSSLFIRPSMINRSTNSKAPKQNEQTSQDDEYKNLARLSTISLFDSTQPRFMELNHSNQDERFIRFGLRSKLATERTMYERLAAAVHAVVRGSTLEPVRLPKYTRNVIVHKVYFITVWILMVVIISSATAIVILFGHHIPTVEGKKWVTVFLCVLLFDALILSTFKILLCSLILGCAFQRLVPTTNYQLKAGDGMKTHLVGDTQHLYRLAELRSHPMYCPLSEKVKELYRQKPVRREQCKTLIDFLVVLLLILVLVMLNSLFTANLYSSNEHAVWMITKGPSLNFQNFSNIYNQYQYSKFIVYNLKDQLHRFIWYNENPLNDNNQMRRKSWTYDCTMRLLGNARIRQLRVILGECPDVNYFENMEENCSPSWSSDVEDTGTYGSRWEIGGIEGLSQKSVAWRYTDAERSNSSDSYGPTLRRYPSGGFIGDLGFTENEFESALSSLFLQNWLDHATRAVFVELTLFNVNTRLFIQVILVAEQMPTGEYLVAVTAQSVSNDISFGIWKFSYIVFLIFFFVRMCFLINRRGVFVYFSQIISMFEGFLLALGFLTFFFYVIHLTTSSDYVQEFQKSGIDEFFNFSNLILYIFVSKTMLVVLFVCVVIRMLISMRFGRMYFTLYYTFILSLPWIVRLVLCLILYLTVIRRLAGFLLNIFVFPKYTTVIIYHKEVSIKDCNDISYKVLLYILCLSSYVVVLLFIASFSYYLKVAKGYKLIDTDNFNFYIFLKETLKRRFNKK